MEPWREEAVRALMQALTSLGRRGEAVRAYRDYEALVRHDLDTSPAPETRALYETISTG
jgi:DNA-binding SARP family transcriptional activator